MEQRVSVTPIEAMAWRVCFDRLTRAPAKQYLYDPVAWAHEMIEWPSGTGLTSYQEEILAAIPSRRKVAVRGPHGLGKTCTISIALLWFATTRDAAGIDWKIPTTASAWRQLTVYLWPEIHKWARRIRWDALGRSAFDEKRELLDLNLKLSVGAASAVASNDSAKIEGAHADSLLYIFDEGKAIPSATWDAAEGAFSGGRTSGLPEAFALAMSTPGPPAGRFYEIHKRSPGLEDWWTKHVTLDEAIKAGRISPEWAEQRRRQWTEGSALYANRVLGDFHASDEDAVIPLSWVEAAVERWHAWVDAGRPPVPGRRVLGVDVARSGADSTVLAHRVGVCVERLEPHHLDDTMRTTARVQAALGDGGVPIVDSAGVGGGVVDRLREVGVRVIAYTGSAKTDARDRTREFGFVNVRSAAYWRLRELLDPAFGSEVMLPPDDLLLADLTTPKWEEVTGVPPKIKVEPKEDVVKRMGRSPDHGDACLIVGTMVATEWGDVPIEQIRPGIRVWTRGGLAPVLASGMTNRDAALLTVELEDGRRLVGTPSHPVWNGERFQRLDSFVSVDRMWVWPQSASSIEGSLLHATRKVNDGIFESTSGPTELSEVEASVRCTSRFGRPRLVPFLTGGMSTTRTAIRWTTGPRISKSSLLAHTCHIMLRPEVAGAGSMLSTWTGCESWRRRGIALRRAVLGMLNTGDDPGSVGEGGRQEHVMDAEWGSRLSSPILRGDAGVAGAATSRGFIAQPHMGWTGHAQSVASLSAPNVRTGPRIVPGRVRRSYASGRGEVWNLTVAGMPEFFANGILVHNCVMSFWADRSGEGSAAGAAVLAGANLLPWGR